MAISYSVSITLSALIIAGPAASVESSVHSHHQASGTQFSWPNSLRSILLQQNSAEQPDASPAPDTSSASSPAATPGADAVASTGAGQPVDAAGTQGLATAISPVLPAQTDPASANVAQLSTLATQGDASNAFGVSATSTAPVVGGVPGIAALQQNTGTAKLGAFGQIATLDAEFNMLHVDDQKHIKQLSFNIQLREKLAQQLKAAQQQLLNDNLQLAQRTATIVGSVGAASAGLVDNATEANAVPVSLLQQRQKTSEQIAADALQRVKALEADIVALRARDDAEVQAIQNNANMRAQLGQRIVAQRTQLQKDAGSLLTDLGQIRSLAETEKSHSGSTAEGADAATTLAPQ